jgi:heterodisulfide reductase subunit A
MSFYDFEELVKLQPCAGSCFVLSSSEPFNEEMEIEVGSIILSPGFDEFEPSLKSEYGYGRFPNVVSSIEFERFLSASGPFKGQVLRPSDKGHPKRIAWIQCVGSRDKTVGNEYCSRVCCMYTGKHARLYKHKVHDGQAYIFYMDIRSTGKGCFSLHFLAFRYDSMLS